MGKTGKEFLISGKAYGVLQFPGDPHQRLVPGRGEAHMEGVVGSEGNEFTPTTIEYGFSPERPIEGPYTVVDVLSPDRKLVRPPINIPVQVFRRKGRR